MADDHTSVPQSDEEIERTIEQFEGGRTGLSPQVSRVIAGVCIAWTLFQLWLASPFPFMFGVGIFTDVPARSIHLAFGLFLAFLI